MEFADAEEHLTMPAASVAAIALLTRIPPFWRDKPRLWFATFEAVTSDQKRSKSQYAHIVIAQLEKQDVEQIADILYDEPADPYTAIKDRLISVYEESESRQLQRLLTEVELGDQKPSQLLRQMKILARNKIPEDTLKLMWTQHLPPHVRSYVTVSETFSPKTSLSELALLADKMLETSPQVSSLSTPASQSIIDEIKKLSLEVAEVKSEVHQSRHQQRPSPGRFSRSPSRHQRQRSSTPPRRLCYYHRRFGEDAIRCTSPCDYRRNSGN